MLNKNIADRKVAVYNPVNTWFMEVFTMERNLSSPAYQQLVKIISDAVTENILKPGDRLPSINCLSAHYNISRATVEKALNRVKELGIIESAPYIGFFVSQHLRLKKHKILLLFNNQMPCNDLIYKSFMERVGQNVQVDCLVFKSNEGVFDRLQNMSDDDGDFVVIPQVGQNFQHLLNQIAGLSEEKLAMVEKFIESLSDPV